MDTTGGANKKLILAAMIFAVSMTFIDMTIVAIAVPSPQDDLSLSSTVEEQVAEPAQPAP
jgi:hypothetical protein